MPVPGLGAFATPRFGNAGAGRLPVLSFGNDFSSEHRVLCVLGRHVDRRRLDRRGPVILRAAHLLSHCHHDVESPVWRPWLEAFSARHRFLRYDPRGCGLSDRVVADLSTCAWQADLEAVAATIDVPRLVLLGLSQGGALAVRYALDHPERVSHLVLVNAYAQGGRVRARTDAERLEGETLVNFICIGWGRENPAFCQFFTNLFIPDEIP